MLLRSVGTWLCFLPAKPLVDKITDLSEVFGDEENGLRFLCGRYKHGQFNCRTYPT